MFRNESFDTVGFESQVSVAKWVITFLNINLTIDKFLFTIYNNINLFIFRPEVSANVQTTEIVYSSSQVQTAERKNAEVNISIIYL